MSRIADLERARFLRDELAWLREQSVYDYNIPSWEHARMNRLLREDIEAAEYELAELEEKGC